MKKLFSVMNEDADLCVLVPASSKLEARNKVYDQVRDPDVNVASFGRLREVAEEKGVSPFVLLKTDEMAEHDGVFLVDD